MFWTHRLDRTLSELKKQVHAPLRVVLWDGREIAFSEKPQATLKIRAARTARALRRPSLLALAEAYIAGEVDLEGNVREAIRGAEAITRARERSLFDDAAPTRWRHSRRADRAAIQYHYDVSNDFYALWLDSRMVYSCAYFRDAGMDLEHAQLAKLDHICTKLRLAPGERFLDIGCGWGALVMHAAAKYGVDATGITLSERQCSLARERIRAAGLEGRCRVLLQDYRDHAVDTPYDKVASVGMFEHVGLRHLPDYFRAVGRLMRERGLFLNHGITSCDVGSRPVGLGAGEFMDRYVFPKGELPHLHAVIHDMSAEGFEVHDVESLRPHYARTLESWSARFERRFNEASAASSEQTARIWRLYLAGCAHAFDQGWVSVHQVLGVRRTLPGPSGLPLTRDWMYRST
jgi:cyclopropane-fatty-acyl-phospholipid synthase